MKDLFKTTYEHKRENFSWTHGFIGNLDDILVVVTFTLYLADLTSSDKRDVNLHLHTISTVLPILLQTILCRRCRFPDYYIN